MGTKNPFKMWGSYIGLVSYILIFVYVIRQALKNEYNSFLMFLANPIGFIFIGSGSGGGPVPDFGGAAIILILNLALYFMLGYIIHLTVRKIRGE